MTTAAPLKIFAQRFHESGFGVIRQAIDPSTVAGLRARLKDLLPPEPIGESMPLQRLVPRLVERDQQFIDLATRPALVATLTSLFEGVIPHLVCSYGHQKPARTAAHTGPHSDVGHLPGVPHHLSLLMIKAMYALTPVTPESGPTLLFPGSHRLPNSEQVAADGGRPALLDPGDLLLFHANIRHSATDNTSTAPRLSLWFVYALPWMRTFPGYGYDPAFLANLQTRLSAEPHVSAVFGLDDPYATAAASARPGDA